MITYIDNNLLLASSKEEAHQQERGCQSRPLTTLAKECWWWCLERAIVLSAEHLPGCLNIIADKESRHMRDRWDWKLHPGLFQRIVETFGPIEVNLFASRLTYQVPLFFTWKPDPQTGATDAFLQRLNQFRGYANPPWGLIARVLSEVRYQSADVVLIAPVWKTQVWYPTLLSLLVGYPYRLPVHREVVWQVHPVPPPFEGDTIQLAAWPISGKAAERKNFLSKLQASSRHHGDPSRTQTTTHSFTSGRAGVIQGIEIPFLVL